MILKQICDVVTIGFIMGRIFLFLMTFVDFVDSVDIKLMFIKLGSMSVKRQRAAFRYRHVLDGGVVLVVRDQDRRNLPMRAKNVMLGER